MLVIAVLAIIASTFLSSDAYVSVKNYYSLRAFYIANAGLEYYRLQLKGVSDWSTPPTQETKVISRGVFVISTTNEAKKQITILSTGLFTAEGKTYGRTLQETLVKKNVIPQFAEYGVYAGSPGSAGAELKFQDASQIVGNFYYFGPINIMGNRPPPCQTEGVIHSTSINPVPSIGVPDYYASWESANSATLPAWDDTYYTYWLDVANQAGGLNNPNLSGTQNLSLSGGTAYYKAFTMSGNSTLTGPGTLCVTGVGGSGRFIAQNYARIIGEVKIVARGTSPNSVSLSDNVSFSNKAEIIALDLIKIDNNVVIPPESTLYSQVSGNAIDGNANCVLQGSILAPFGTVTMNNSAWIKGLTYASNLQMYTSSTIQGGAVFETSGYFHNTTRAIQDETVLPTDYPMGLSAEATVEVDTISNWSEVY